MLYNIPSYKEKNNLTKQEIKMTNNNIKIEIEMRDSTAMFSVNRMVGYRSFTNGDDFETTIHLADEDDNRHLITFATNLAGIEDVARVINGIHELNLGKQEEVEIIEEDLV
jgi:hypothetical protein